MIILYLMIQIGSFNNALPILSLYVFAGYRLMPSLQLVYRAITQLTFIGPSLDKLHEDLKNIDTVKKNNNQASLSFNDSISLKNVSYSYPNTSNKSLKNINIKIHTKSTVGLVGPTGSGKTTTVDILLGLLTPKDGSLEVDGNLITHKNSRAWQRNIGYVPQDIYLSDDTVAANIAFGLDNNTLINKLLKRHQKLQICMNL